jgi:hypothetical protein
MNTTPYADGAPTTTGTTGGTTDHTTGITSPDLYELMDSIDRREHEQWKEARKSRRTNAKTRTPTQPRESDIQRDVSNLCAKYGYLVVRVNSFAGETGEDATDSRFVGGSGKIGGGKRYMRSYHIANLNASAGHSDLVVYKGGNAWFLEIKRPGGKLSAAQQRFADACGRYGMPYHVVTSTEDALRVLGLV